MKTWLQAIRDEKGLKQKDVAEICSITQVSYSNIENGKRRPSVDTAKKIAAVLGFDWTRFYEEGGEQDGREGVYAFRAEDRAPAAAEHVGR